MKYEWHTTWFNRDFKSGAWVVSVEQGVAATEEEAVTIALGVLNHHPAWRLVSVVRVT